MGDMNPSLPRYSLRPRPLQPSTRQRHLNTRHFQHITADIESTSFDTDDSSYAPSSLETDSSHPSSLVTESQLSQASSCDLFGLEAIAPSTHTPGSSILEGKQAYYNSLNPEIPTYQQQVGNKIEYWTREAIIRWAKTKRTAPSDSESPSPPRKRHHGNNKPRQGSAD